MDAHTAEQLVRGRPWHHDFEIVPGVRTHGSYDPSGLWGKLGLPDDLHGLSLADVGASNGYFSFEARRRGARVVAFDFRHKDNSGFGLAQHINGMADIQHHHINVLDLRQQTCGTFDVVLALGLLYHTSDPYRALASCAELSARRLLIESYCIDDELPANVREQPIMRFLQDPLRFPQRAHPSNDRSNFWGFTTTCLCRMVEDVGFAVRRSSKSADRVVLDCERLADSASTRLAIAYRCLPAVPRNGSPDDPAAWTVF